jgi:hypothetical protein
MWITPIFYLWLLPTRAELEIKLKKEEETDDYSVV